MTLCNNSCQCGKGWRNHTESIPAKSGFAMNVPFSSGVCYTNHPQLYMGLRKMMLRFHPQSSFWMMFVAKKYQNIIWTYLAKPFVVGEIPMFFLPNKTGRWVFPLRLDYSRTSLSFTRFQDDIEPPLSSLGFISEVRMGVRMIFFWWLIPGQPPKKRRGP